MCYGKPSSSRPPWRVIGHNAESKGNFWKQTLKRCSNLIKKQSQRQPPETAVAKCKRVKTGVLKEGKKQPISSATPSKIGESTDFDGKKREPCGSRLGKE
jgi:hypothetical protein